MIPSPVAPLLPLIRIFDRGGMNIDAILEIGGKLVVIWLVAGAGWLVVQAVARRIIATVDDGDDSTLTAAEKRGHTLAHLLKGVGRVVILGAAALLSVHQFVDITPLLAGFGLLGLAVSFGAQSLVKDVIGGFFLLVENQFALGDVIEAAGKGGVVERMTLRVVHLRDLDGSLHIIPNGQIAVVTNKTRGWSRAVIELGIGYETDLDRALLVFGDEARKLAADPAWAPRLDGPPEVSGVIALGDSSIVVRTMLRTKPGQHWDVAREFRRRIKLRLDAEGIDIPFPQQVIHYRYPPGAGPERSGARPAAGS